MRKVLIVIGLWLLAAGARAANIGPVLPVSDAPGNQQNPAVVALPDRGLWFVAWEDWRADGLESDIKGAFVRLKEAALAEGEECAPPLIRYRGRCYEGAEVCAGPFLVSDSEDGWTNQYQPDVAYDHKHGKILVLWQDDRYPYLWFRPLSVPDSCREPEKHRVQRVPDNPVLDCLACRGTCACSGRVGARELCQEANLYWNLCNDTCYQYAFENNEDNNNNNNNNANVICCDLTQQCYLGDLTYQELCEDLVQTWSFVGRTWRLYWDENEGQCLRVLREEVFLGDSCEDRLYFDQPPVWDPDACREAEQCDCEDFCDELFSEALPNDEGNGEGGVPGSDIESCPLEVLDALLSRKHGRVAYSPREDAFFFAWMEKKSVGNVIRERVEWHLYEVQTGEGVLPVYARLDVSGDPDWDRLEDEGRWEVHPLATSAPAPGEQTARMARVVQEMDGEMTGDDLVPECPEVLGLPGSPIKSLKYELFVDPGEIALAANTADGGALLTWSASRVTFYLVLCTTGATTNWVVLEEDAKRVWALSSHRATVKSFPSRRLSEEGPSFRPAVEFDPVTNRYLVVWEDSRDSGPNRPRIYGQLLDGLAEGLYHANFPLVLQEDLPNLWGELVQSEPEVTWDPVNQRFLVLWQDNRASTVSVENIDVWAQRVDPEGSLRGKNFLLSVAEDGEPAYGNQLAPDAAFDPSTGVYLAVWKDARNYEETGADLYAQAFGVDQPQLALYVEDEEGRRVPLHPSVLDFGVLRVGERATRSLYLVNTGDATLALCELSPLAPPFAYLLLPQRLSDGDESSCLYLEPGMEEEVMVEFAPEAEGGFSQEIEITSSAGDRTLVVQGSARQVVSVNRTRFDFGEVVVGNQKTLDFYLINHDQEAILVTDTFVPAPFALEGLRPGQELPPGATIRASVVFSPESEGTFAGEAVLYFSKGGQIELHLSGTGKGSSFEVRAEPEELDFGYLALGQSATLYFQVKNPGEEGVEVRAVEGPEAPFRVDELEVGQVIAPNGVLTVPVVFSPWKAGVYTSSLTLVLGREEEEVRVSVSLHGQAMLLPACVYETLPSSAVLMPGQNPLWLVSVSGDEGLGLGSPPLHPVTLDLVELYALPGRYLYLLLPPPDLAPGLYRDRFALQFVGARNMLSFETTLSVQGLPSFWTQAGCAPPALDLRLEGERWLYVSLPHPPTDLGFSLRLDWPCAPPPASAGTVRLTATSPAGTTYHYDLLQGFVPWEKGYTVQAPLHYEGSLPLPAQSLAASPGPWLFELRLEAGGAVFYTQALLLVDGVPEDMCHMVDLGE